MPLKNLPNLKIPGYKILNRIGRGSMAQVYRAEQEGLEREVAIKVMKESLLVEPEFSQRFIREAKIIAQLSHQNIVSVYTVGVHEGCHYLVMELHKGGNLKQKLKQGLPVEEAMRIAKQIARSLDFAHQKRFVHRDIKPENIVFNQDDQVILTDFGIAVARDAANKLTAEGTIVGSPKYMSPEQAQGLDVDGRADIYSLGVVIYEMLTGVVPYKANNPVAICQMHITEPIPKLSGKNKKFQDLIDRCMAKDPNQRPSTGNAIIDLIEAIEQGRQTQEINIHKEKNNTLIEMPRELVHNIEFGRSEKTVKIDYNVDDDQKPVVENKLPDTVVNEKHTIGDKHQDEPAPSPIDGLTAVSERVPHNSVWMGALAAMILLAVVIGVKEFMMSKAIEPAVIAQDASISSPAAEPKPISRVKFINSVKLFSPQAASLCTTKTPYLLGTRVIGENDSLKQGECFSIQVDARREAELIIYSQSQDGTIYRLLPSKCNAMGIEGRTIKAGESISFPVTGNKMISVIGLDNNPGREWVYTIAVKDAFVRQIVLDSMASVPDVCDDTKGGMLAVEEVQQKLDTLSSEMPGDMQWLSQSFVHELL